MAPGANHPLLEVRHLQVRYGTRLAVAAVDFDIAPGESLGLVGESGSGKTSIARALLGLIPASGSANFQGHDLMSLRGKALRATREHLQVVFQNPHGALDPRMNVAALVAEPLLEFRPALDENARLETAAAMLAQVGLGPEHLARFPHQLSGGQVQRVGIARALILRPKLLICDEPTAALDVSIRAQIANLLRDLRDQLRLSLLLITHDLATVRFLCDRIAVLYRGQIVEMAARETIFQAPLHPYTRALLAAHPAPDPTQLRPPTPPLGVIAHALIPAGSAGQVGGCSYRDRCPIAVPRCANEIPLPRQIGSTQVTCHRADE